MDVNNTGVVTEKQTASTGFHWKVDSDEIQHVMTEGLDGVYWLENSGHFSILIRE